MRRATLLLTACLAGCATVQPPVAPELDWAARQAGVESLRDWRMTGRVAIVVGDEGGSAGVEWRQAGDTSDVALTGPLGVGGMRALLDGTGLTLEDGRGERFHGPAAEGALQARLGGPVPLEYLRYWLLGAPAPGEPFEPALPGGAAASFRQSGWTVGIDRMEPAADRVLPTRLTVTRQDTRLKLVVTRWDLPP